jgi:hypothetical protein
MVDLKQRNFLQGLVYIVGGVTLLLYTFGLIETGINLILIIVAIIAIIYGLLQSGFLDALKQLFKK